MDLSAYVADCLDRHGLTNTVGIIAVSGGPDSVALAHLCVRLLHEGKIARLIFAHVNHQLRGSESDGDETFVQGLPGLWLANDPCLICRTTRIDVGALAKEEHDNLEATARRVRYEWFTQLADGEGAAWLAVGHSADDQAETVLFRLLRGAGILGLGGMAECRPLGTGVSLLRPLLSVRRQALLDYLHDKQIAYRVDSSNRELRFTRNRLRHELLPLLQQNFNPALVEVLCRLAEQARDLQADIGKQAGHLLGEAELPRAGAMRVFSVDRLTKVSANQVREMFRLVWQREGWPMGDMDFTRWDRLVEITSGACSACDFPGNIHVRRVGRVVQVYASAGV